MAVLYEVVARVVAAAPTLPVAPSGDCTTSLATVAARQRVEENLGIVWLDADGDFNTEARTDSDYLAGWHPRRSAVSAISPPCGPSVCAPSIHGASSWSEQDLNPPEQQLLDSSAVSRSEVGVVSSDALPDGPLYMHLDLDLSDPADIAELRYPAPDGPDPDELSAAILMVVGSGRISAIGLALTWGGCLA